MPESRADLPVPQTALDNTVCSSEQGLGTQSCMSKHRGELPWSMAVLSREIGASLSPIYETCIPPLLLLFYVFSSVTSICLLSQKLFSPKGFSSATMNTKTYNAMKERERREEKRGASREREREKALEKMEKNKKWGMLEWRWMEKKQERETGKRCDIVFSIGEKKVACCLQKKFCFSSLLFLSPSLSFFQREREREEKNFLSFSWKS